MLKEFIDDRCKVRKNEKKFNIPTKMAARWLTITIFLRFAKHFGVEPIPMPSEFLLDCLITQYKEDSS